MAFMTENGFRLHYEDTGGDAPTVVFLHGAGGNHMSWGQQVPAFAEEYRCVTLDRRGFARSPDVPNGPGPAERPDVFNREVGAFLKGHRP
jgi:3-oxoadipate enol-lactonase